MSFDARDILDGWMVEWWVIAGAWLGSVARLLACLDVEARVML